MHQSPAAPRLGVPEMLSPSKSYAVNSAPFAASVVPVVTPQAPDAITSSRFLASPTDALSPQRALFRAEMRRQMELAEAQLPPVPVPTPVMPSPSRSLEQAWQAELDRFQTASSTRRQITEQVRTQLFVVSPVSSPAVVRKVAPMWDDAEQTGPLAAPPLPLAATLPVAISSPLSGTPSPMLSSPTAMVATSSIVQATGTALVEDEVKRALHMQLQQERQGITQRLAAASSAQEHVYQQEKEHMRAAEQERLVRETAIQNASALKAESTAHRIAQVAAAQLEAERAAERQRAATAKQLAEKKEQERLAKEQEAVAKAEEARVMAARVRVRW
jgi:hypothetical protein